MNDYKMRCCKCGIDKGLQAVAHRNKKGFMVGWLFSCVKCFDEIKNGEVQVVRPKEGQEMVKRYIESEKMASKRIIHGQDCEKVEHDREGLLHTKEDDTPFNDDGVEYCGRCHSLLW